MGAAGKRRAAGKRAFPPPFHEHEARRKTARTRVGLPGGTQARRPWGRETWWRECMSRFAPGDLVPSAAALDDDVTGAGGGPRYTGCRFSERSGDRPR